jgi:cyclophilin family peptidyl-prolyl cis-trans isomerase
VPSGKRERKRSKQERQQAYQAAAQRRRRRQGRLVTGTVIVAVLGIGFVGILSFATRGDEDEPSAVANQGSTTSTTSFDAPCPKADGSSTRRSSFRRPPKFCIDPEKTYRARMETDVGTFVIELDTENAPETTNNFVFLARYHFFDQIPFHRVAKGFVIQGGNPPGEGVIGPGYTFADENVPRDPYKYAPGDVMMARELPNTNGSQFLIATGAEAATLPLAYPLFAKVVEGIDVVNRIDADGGERRRPADQPVFEPKVMHTLIQVTILES